MTHVRVRLTLGCRRSNRTSRRSSGSSSKLSSTRLRPAPLAEEMADLLMASIPELGRAADEDFRAGFAAQLSEQPDRDLERDAHRRVARFDRPAGGGDRVVARARAPRRSAPCAAAGLPARSWSRRAPARGDCRRAGDRAGDPLAGACPRSPITCSPTSTRSAPSWSTITSRNGRSGFAAPPRPAPSWSRAIVERQPVDARAASEKLRYDVSRRHVALIVWADPTPCRTASWFARERGHGAGCGARRRAGADGADR